MKKDNVIDDKLSLLLKHSLCHEELNLISLQQMASHSLTSFCTLVESSASLSSGDLSQHFRNKFVRDDNTAVNESGLFSITSILILLFVTCVKFALKTKDEGGSLGAAAINSGTTALGLWQRIKRLQLWIKASDKTTNTPNSYFSSRTFCAYRCAFSVDIG